MTSSPRRPRAQGWALRTAALVAFAAPAVALALAASAVRGAASPFHPDAVAPAAPDGVPDSAALAPIGPRPPAAPGWVRVETEPPGARIWINGIDAGTAPVAPFETASGRVVVRAFRGDPRRFLHVSDGVERSVAPGETLRVRLDLRPRVLLRSDPEPASVALLATRPEEPTTDLGATPLWIAPARLEGRRVRFAARGYADSVIAGATLAAARASGDPVAITLRPLGLSLSPPPARKPSLVGRRWFQWALVGAGAALTGGAAMLRHEGDRTYERYLAASNPEEIERLYDRTVRYDRWSSAALGAGQVALTAGAFLLVSGLGR